MDFEKDILPAAFDVLKSRELDEQEKQHRYWKQQAKDALETHLSQKDFIDAEEALLWNCLGDYDGTNELEFNTGYERKLAALQQTLEAVAEPGSVSLVIGRRPKQEDDDDLAGEDDNSLRSMYPHSDMLLLDGTTLSGIADVTFKVPRNRWQPDGARQDAAASAVFWMSHPGLAEQLERTRDFEIESRKQPEEEHDFDDSLPLAQEDQERELYTGHSYGNATETGFHINQEKTRDSDMHPVEVDLNLLTDRVITKDTPLTPELLEAVMTEGGYMVTGKDAIAHILEALDPERCIIPELHDIPNGLHSEDIFAEGGELARELQNHPFQKLLNRRLSKVAGALEALTPNDRTPSVGDLSIMQGRGLPFGRYINHGPGQIVRDMDLWYKPELHEDLQLVHGILLGIEKHERQLFQRGIARIVRNGRGLHEQFSDHDRYTGLLLGDEGIAVRNIVQTERDAHVQAMLDAASGDIISLMLSNNDPFTASKRIQQESRATLRELGIINWHYEEYFDIPPRSSDELHRLVKEGLQDTIEQAKLNIERLGQTALQRFDEFKDDPAFNEDDE